MLMVNLFKDYNEDHQYDKGWMTILIQLLKRLSSGFVQDPLVSFSDYLPLRVNEDILAIRIQLYYEYLYQLK